MQKTSSPLVEPSISEGIKSYLSEIARRSRLPVVLSATDDLISKFAIPAKSTTFRVLQFRKGDILSETLPGYEERVVCLSGSYTAGADKVYLPGDCEKVPQGECHKVVALADDTELFVQWIPALDGEAIKELAS